MSDFWHRELRADTVAFVLTADQAAGLHAELRAALVAHGQKPYLARLDEMASRLALDAEYPRMQRELPAQS